jgi:hypothetical protein
MSNFPTNKLTGLSLLKNDLQKAITPTEYLYLDISLFDSDPVKYGNILFQNKIVILAELGTGFNLGIPSPENIPRPDGFKIRLMNNVTSGWPFYPQGTNYYSIYTLDNDYGFQTVIQYMYLQSYLTLIWKEADQTWYPIRDIIETNSIVTIAKPLPQTTFPSTTTLPTTEQPYTIPPSTDPPTSVPPTTDPPTTDPPTSVPPTTGPPTSVPPTTVSPTTQMPTNAAPLFNQKKYEMPHIPKKTVTPNPPLQAAHIKPFKMPQGKELNELFMKFLETYQNTNSIG